MTDPRQQHERQQVAAEESQTADRMTAFLEMDCAFCERQSADGPDGVMRYNGQPACRSCAENGPPLCDRCAGSGEGMHPGSVCGACKGRGEVVRG